MKLGPRFTLLAGLLLLPVAFSVSLLPTKLVAQSTTSGEIVGNMVDSTGAIISNTDIAVNNVDTGAVTRTKGSSAGELRVPSLIPGSYNTSVSVQGFSIYTVKNLQISLNKASTAAILLAPHSASQAVEVSAEAAVTLDTTSANPTHTFETNEPAVSDGRC
jgi:hypothetical protein